jgi:uncharacterized protein YjbI with pentapeptide repeats
MIQNSNYALYQESKEALLSLIKQLGLCFVCFIVMLLWTGESPSSSDVEVTFCIAVVLVAWCEGRRRRVKVLKKKLTRPRQGMFTYENQQRELYIKRVVLAPLLIQDVTRWNKWRERFKQNIKWDEWNELQAVSSDVDPDLYPYIYRADLSDTDLSYAYLSGANLSGANLSHTDLSGANLSGANLSGADIPGANFRDADLSGANLRRVNLSEIDLGGANLRRVNLSGVNLSRVNLSGVNLSGADLSGADLSGADLSGADLSGADLSGADLSGANVENSRFGQGVGLSVLIQRDLSQRGAIFDDVPGDRASISSPAPVRR